MASFVKTFSGFLDLDTHPSRVGHNDYIDALNITRDFADSNMDGVVGNIQGNQIVSYTYPAGTNTCIGGFDDRRRNRLIYFVWNSNGYHSILSFDATTRTITKIFESRTDSGGADILNLQLSYKVNDIHVIYRDQEGDLLLFNDAFNTPGKLNIRDFINGLYTPVTGDLIRVQKRVPPGQILPLYQSDTSSKVNNLKKKLFQFSQAWIYADYEISTMSAPSKVVLPINAFSTDTESDPSANNVLVLQVAGGPKDYKSVRIFGRESLGAVWGDWFIVDTLDAIDYNIPPFGTYSYKFLNDAEYVTADPDYTSLNFDNAPDGCNSLAVVNGNVIVEGGITDGRDAIKRADVNVQITAGYKEISGNVVAPSNPTITQFVGISGGAYYTWFEIGPSVGDGSVYKIKLSWLVVSGGDLNIDVTYTANGTDTAGSVADALVALVTTQATGKPFTVSNTTGIRVNIQDQQHIAQGGRQPDSATYSAVPQILQSGGSATWGWNRKIRLGLIYQNDYGKSNGVVSFVSSATDPNDFSVTTGDFNFNPANGNLRIPVINASISHVPPSWATRFAWVRVPTDIFFLQYITAEVQNDSQYNYFGIENLNVFRTQNSGFVPSYVFSPGDRLRVYAEVSALSPIYSVPTPVGDYEILGSVDRKPTGGADDLLGQYLKTRRLTGGGPEYGPHMMIEIYRPSTRTTTDATQVFYTFGENYPIYTASTGARYHTGKNQNQTASQPATFVFEDGDVYFKFRDFYGLSGDGTVNINAPYAEGVMDANYSDFFVSSINSNGSPWVIEADAKRLYRPIEIRFSEAFQPGTNINGLNRFYTENYIEVILANGDIKRMLEWNNNLLVFQQHKIGRVPVLQQIWTDLTGKDNTAVSEKLLNRVQYYSGEYGVGNAPESIAWNNHAVYGWDTLRRVCWRVSQNGLEALSIKHKINGFSIRECASRGFDSKIYGVFDAVSNNYISAFEASTSSTAKTLAWSEDDNGFESFLSYMPEMMCSLNTLFVTFKDGQLYTHDSGTYNIFYGVNFESSITAVFNENVNVKKIFNNITELADSIWDVPSFSTNVVGVPTTKQKLLTNISAAEFKTNEGDFYAAVPFSTVGHSLKSGGESMRGNYAIVKLRKQAAQNFEALISVILTEKESVKNPK
jgi:hypothetical protein